MNERINRKIEDVSNTIDMVFANNEPERVKQLMTFVKVIATAPDEILLEKAVDNIRSELRNGL